MPQTTRAPVCVRNRLVSRAAIAEKLKREVAEIPLMVVPMMALPL